MPLSEIAISYAWPWRAIRAKPFRLWGAYFGTANDFAGMAVEVRVRSEAATAK